MTAEDVLAVVRVHADRVHDAVRRLGCAPAAAVEVVETSAFDLVDALRNRPDGVGDPVGWWFARACLLGRSVADDVDDLPLGAGVLSTDRGQARLAEALETRPEQERTALLLRDSYDLPASVVGRALGLDADGAMAAVGRARMALLPLLADGPVAELGAHPADVATLARLGEGGQVATRDATTRRHVQSCEICGAAVYDQERTRRLLRGLSVIALLEGDREALLVAVDAYSHQALPTAPPPLVPLTYDEDDEEEPLRRRGLSLPLGALGVVLAILLGLLVGLYLSQSKEATAPSAAANGLQPSPTEDPTPSLAPTPSPTPSPTVSATPSPSPQPTTNVFTITPSPAPSAAPSVAPSAPRPAPPPPVVLEPLALSLAPDSGPNGTLVQASGRGWTPGASVTLVYRDQLGRDTGSGAIEVVDARGRFTASLAANDPINLPGRHTVVADDGTHTAEAAFTSTG